MEMFVDQVLDASVALIAEGYQSLGADWWTALEEAGKIGTKEVPETLTGEQKPVTPAREKTEEEKVAENNAVLASLMGGLKDSTFKGVKA